MVITSTNDDAVLAQPNASADTTTPSSRISINVVVKDSMGRPIHDLQADDFTVFDNNEPQRLLAFRAVVVRDATASYALTVKASHSDRSNEYHKIDVRVDRSNLEVRTIRGYFAHNQSSGQ
jgi:hypothetical protein